MTPSKHLWDLIHSLDSSEKRAFRLFAGRHVHKKDSQYLLLFDAVLAQTVYNEVALKAISGDQGSASRFSVAKHDLIELILDCLRDYHRTKFMEMELRRMLDHVALLRERGLSEMAGRWIQKAYKKAKEMGATEQILEVIRLQNVQEKSFPGKDHEKKLDRLYKVEFSALRALQQESESMKVHDEVFRLVQQGGKLPVPVVRQRLGRLLNSGILKEKPAEMSFQARLNYFYTRAFASQLKSDLPGTYSNFREIVAVWEENPKRTEFQKVRYLRAVRFMIDYAIEAGDLKELPDTLARLRARAEKWNLEAHLQFQFVDHLFIRYYMNSGALEEAEKMAPRYEKGFLESEANLSLNSRLGFYFNVTILHFLLENHKTSLKWLRSILDLPQLVMRTDIQQFARILQLVLHYELGNFDIIENLLRSSLRYLKKTRELDDFESLMVAHFRKMLNLPMKQIPSACKKLAENLGELKEKESDRLGLEEVYLWSKARARGLRIRELVHRP